MYAAPEVVLVEKRNTAAELWSLGFVFLEMATVLKGKTVQDMQDYFEESSGSQCFHNNIDHIATWVDGLRQVKKANDNAALNWALSILQEEQQRRPTAASLCEDIVRDSIVYRTAFCGSCCEGLKSPEDEDDDAAL